MSSYAELQVTSNFCFLRGASHPEEMVKTAKTLGLAAIAITDRNSLAGVVRAHRETRINPMRLIIGCRLDLQDGPSLLCYPTDRAAYGRLCRLLTLGKRRAEKGQCSLFQEDLTDDFLTGQILIALDPDEASLCALVSRSPGAVYLAAQHLLTGGDEARLARLAALAEATGAPLVATNDVHYHIPSRRPLQDVLTCIREGCTIEDAGHRLFPNAERHLKGASAMADLFRDYPDALARTLEIADRCRFNLDELKYDYPDEPVPPGSTPQEYLEFRTWAGALERYPDGVPDKVKALLRRELSLIAFKGYAPYFLTVNDIVAFAKARGILCQGRGSAANSAVCYVLGITNVDPKDTQVLFERFINIERNEPPDIDVDFEHERREEVIQYLYTRYGRHRAGLAATVISYQGRSAIREVGKVLGLSEDITSSLSGQVWGSYGSGVDEDRVRQAGLDPSEPRLSLALRLTGELLGFPRHLSQHVGGFVLTRTLLEDTVPIGNAAMEDRTFIEWDKDDINALGMMKVDVLALGMLTCIKRAFAMLQEHDELDLELHSVPPDDPQVYDMLCRAESLGVFQVESRAQMNMLPRLKPRVFYDLVIQVAIVRPGPIQGNMVHPYLKRRNGEEAFDDSIYGRNLELKEVLERTFGVPIFQEQAMRIAQVAAQFTESELNELRYAMATFRRRGTIGELEDKMVGRMVARGYDPEFAQNCFNQIKGFGEYGFPESHSASFSRLVYISAWLKCHHPAIFAAALLNSQPMGFYAPAQIVGDARKNHVEVRAADINRSDWDCAIEAGRYGHALRLGLRLVQGLGKEAAQKLIKQRGVGYHSVEALQRRAGLSRRAVEALAEADAFGSLGLERREALWAAKALTVEAPLPLFAMAGEDVSLFSEPEPNLPLAPASEAVIEDYRATGLSLKDHPASFLREYWRRERIITSAEVAKSKDGARINFSGLVLVRQRPGTSKGVVFVTLEDEFGIVNGVIWSKTVETYRRVLMTARVMEIRGRLQRTDSGAVPVIHLVAEHLEDRSGDLARLTGPGRYLPIEPPPQQAKPFRAGHPRNTHAIPRSRDFK
ncbi:error-prone DNA polymerase [Lacibacterium aquatile]|uniref:Error-prone DNA polymerase n=1 Tax=Lacibacterium aquatile TaxID=1168082 RepID=A0ABW5DVF9_9PROT